MCNKMIKYSAEFQSNNEWFALEPNFTNSFRGDTFHVVFAFGTP